MIREAIASLWGAVLVVAYGVGYLLFVGLALLVAVSIPGVFIKLFEWGMAAFPDWGWLFTLGQAVVVLGFVAWWASLNPEPPEGEGGGGSGGASGRWGASKAKWYVVNWGRKW